jgi:mutator protein MutT
MGIKIKIINFAIRFLKNRQVLAGAPAIILNSKKEILLGKRSKNLPYYPSLWGLPGGVIEYKESAENAVKRELREEMGIIVKIIKTGKPCMIFPSKEYPFQVLEIPFYCKILKDKPKAKDETSEIKWFKPKEIKKMKLAYSHKQILKQEGLI